MLNATTTPEVYTEWFVGSVRVVSETVRCITVLTHDSMLTLSLISALKISFFTIGEYMNQQLAGVEKLLRPNVKLL